MHRALRSRCGTQWCWTSSLPSCGRPRRRRQLGLLPPQRLDAIGVEYLSPARLRGFNHYSVNQRGEHCTLLIEREASPPGSDGSLRDHPRYWIVVRESLARLLDALLDRATRCQPFGKRDLSVGIGSGEVFKKPTVSLEGSE